MSWILTICTAGWLLCGQLKTVEYQSEEQCYRGLDNLYKQHTASSFNYVTCEPKVVVEGSRDKIEKK